MERTFVVTRRVESKGNAPKHPELRVEILPGPEDRLPAPPAPDGPELILASQFTAAVGPASFPYKGGGFNITFHVPFHDKMKAIPLVDLKGMELVIKVYRPPLYHEVDVRGNYEGDAEMIKLELHPSLAKDPFSFLYDDADAVEVDE